MPRKLLPYDPTPLLERCAELDDWRIRLDRGGTFSRRWAGRLRRDLEAEAVAGSVSMEQVPVTVDEVRRILAGERVPDVDQSLVLGYREAMEYVLRRTDDPGFGWSRELVVALHDRAGSTRRPRRSIPFATATAASPACSPRSPCTAEASSAASSRRSRNGGDTICPTTTPRSACSATSSMRARMSLRSSWRTPAQSSRSCGRWIDASGSSGASGRRSRPSSRTPACSRASSTPRGTRFFKRDVTPSYYMPLTDVSRATATNDLGAAVAAGLLEPHGAGRSRRYVAGPALYERTAAHLDVDAIEHEPRRRIVAVLSHRLADGSG